MKTLTNVLLRKMFEIMHIELYHMLVEIHSNVFTVLFVYKCCDFQLHITSTILVLLVKCYFVIFNTTN